VEELPRSESVELSCADGWRLSGELMLRADARAVAVVSHAMMVDRRTLQQPKGAGLATELWRAGLHVLLFDQRGHGRSGPGAHEGGDWSYDDLVEKDVPAVLNFARQQFPSLPIGAVGHSLFGHVMLAHLARHPEHDLMALAMIAGNVYQPAWRRRPLSYAKKRLLLAAMALVARGGPHPARRLRLGTADESAGYVADFLRWARIGDWAARDGFSYLSHLGRVAVPVLGIVGAGDRTYAPSADVRDLLAALPRSTVEVVGLATGLPFDPGHMSIVLDARARPVWRRVAEFLVSAAGG
jgi:predicted alpha/beta hydrolase